MFDVVVLGMLVVGAFVQGGPLRVLGPDSVPWSIVGHNIQLMAVSNLLLVGDAVPISKPNHILAAYVMEPNLTSREWCGWCGLV